ncbi:MAG: cytochrome C oxidase subunit II, partial [Spirochaetales bacterium]|nr:cytochrome C oxidase subunit II [Spirochaetales bacterium]
MSEITRSPNVFHPTRLSAIGSRNSLAQEGRRQKDEFEQLVQEETQNIINLVQTKLPREVLEKLEVMGGLKEKLYNYFNQNYQNMFNRYIVTTEDEMAKKIRNFIDKEEGKTLARYSPREVAELLEKISGAERFNTGGVEKSIVNMFGNLQTHIEKSVVELENETESLLEQRTDVGAFVGGDNTYSVVKCAFKDNPLKPKTVTDVKLSINVLDSELISPIFHYQSTMEFLVKDLISRAITDSIEREIEIFSRQLAEGGREPDEKEIIFEKMKRVSNYTDDKPEDEQSKRYTLMAKSLMDRIDGLRAEISPADFDPLNIR